MTTAFFVQAPLLESDKAALTSAIASAANAVIRGAGGTDTSPRPDRNLMTFESAPRLSAVGVCMCT
jgi:hypothetical protein